MLALPFKWSNQMFGRLSCRSLQAYQEAGRLPPSTLEGSDAMS